MTKNVGKIDRTLRMLLGLFLGWLGLFILNGIEGNILGILVALISLVPFYMVVTGSCFVFNWFNIHSLSKTECIIYGEPYSKNK